MVTHVLHMLIRWVSAVFTGIEAFKRATGWPEESFGSAAALVWLIVTLLLVAPEILMVLERTSLERSFLRRYGETLGFASSVTCVCLAIYLVYITSGGTPPPGDHL